MQIIYYTYTAAITEFYLDTVKFKPERKTLVNSGFLVCERHPKQLSHTHWERM